MASIYAQTLCEIVGLDILEQAARDSAEGYSIGPIAGYEPEGFFVATLQLAIVGLFAQAPNPALDFTGVIESALYFADNSVWAAGVPVLQLATDPFGRGFGATT